MADGPCVNDPEDDLARLVESVLTETSTPAEALQAVITRSHDKIPRQMFTKLKNQKYDLTFDGGVLTDWIKNRLETLFSYSELNALLFLYHGSVQSPNCLFLMLSDSYNCEDLQYNPETTDPDIKHRDENWDWCSKDLRELQGLRSTKKRETVSDVITSFVLAHAFIAASGKMIQLALETMDARTVLGSSQYRFFLIGNHMPIVLGMVTSNGWRQLRPFENAAQMFKNEMGYAWEPPPEMLEAERQRDRELNELLAQCMSEESEDKQSATKKRNRKK